MQTLSPETESSYLPHSVNTEFFKPLSLDERAELRETMGLDKDKFIVFWNNRNARRKQSGTLIFWFKEFIDKVGHDNAMLIMHTDPKDPNGPNLLATLEKLNLTDGQVQFSTQKIDFAQLAALYNCSDLTVNISDAEGFGLSTLESLSCGTPIVVNMTGGLQEQVTNGEEWFGVGLEPASKCVIGSQDIPYIYEDRVNSEDFVNALLKMYEFTKEQRHEVGMKGRQHVEENYSYEKFCNSWDQTLTAIYEKYGGWGKRTDYKKWTLTEVTK